MRRSTPSASRAARSSAEAAGPTGKGFFVEPTIVKAQPDLEMAREETFAPILYVFEYEIARSRHARMHNSVDQGLSSAVFTSDLISAHRRAFPLARGLGLRHRQRQHRHLGAEIGGAFGGEKETGGGREAGSDAWKGYMRRQTCTINWGGELPLGPGCQVSTSSSTPTLQACPNFEALRNLLRVRLTSFYRPNGTSNLREAPMGSPPRPRTHAATMEPMEGTSSDHR